MLQLSDYFLHKTLGANYDTDSPITPVAKI
jgi:hypothetical protein